MHSKPSIPTLIVIAGPTAVGKTRFAIELAEKLGTDIISADSRQFYSELSIGTAKPSVSELERVQHHFIGNLSIHDYYNVSMFEKEVLTQLNEFFLTHDKVLMVGGSGLYIDAVCKGVDEFPDPDPDLRSYLKGILADEGIDKLRELLREHDPVYYQQVDLSNPNRILRALEVSLHTGKPYSGQRTNSGRKRDFAIVKTVINLPREELFSRINLRVDQMIANGLLEEVKSLQEYRHLNALNTVGYKELFEYLDGNVSFEQAIENIKTNTRRYAKRQLTWFKKDTEYQWYTPYELNEYLNF